MSESTDPTPPPWYHQGLQFKCTQCGNCCTGAPGHVWVEPEEITAIAEFLDVPVGEIRLLHTRLARGKMSLREYANGDCTFFDPYSRRCRIYPVRPKQCRTWPFWRSNLSSPEIWEQVCQICPGIGQGEAVPLEVINRNLSEIDI